jgi:phage gp29-like protein
MPNDFLWGPNGEKIAIKQEQQEHFASRQRAGMFLDLLWNVLPDPDPILARVGKTYSGLRELMMDEQVEAAWTSREAAVTRTPWSIVPGAVDREARKVADFCREIYTTYKIKTINQGLLEHVLYGYQPAELLWDSIDGRWIPLDIVPKPQEWFAFNSENTMVFRTGLGGTEELPPYRFLVLQHRPTFTNPYGVKLLSKIFWSVTFRRNGARWWAVFTEKYGGAFATAKHRPGAPEAEINDILRTLEDLVTCGVAVFPEGTTIDITTDATKAQATGNFKDFESFFNENISKVILGGTLTTDVGDRGSYSAAKVHGGVRDDIALSDRDSIAEAHNDVLRMITRINFGDTVAVPQFVWEEAEDLKTATVERDSKLFSLGWRPTKEYIKTIYGMADEHFDIAAPGNSGTPFRQQVRHAVKPQDGANSGKAHSAALFATEADDATEDHDLVAFVEKKARDGQVIIDAMIREYATDADAATSYEDAFERMASRYKRQLKHRRKFASAIDNIRYAVSQLAASREKEDRTE